MRWSLILKILTLKLILMVCKKLKTPVCPDRYYHIYNRGNNKEKLFYHSGDYHFFMGKYKEYVSPFADTYAFCLLPNHFHFLIKTGEKTNSSISAVSNQLRRLFIAYTKRINNVHNRSGSLFTKNFQRIEIDSDQYFTQVVRYIHKNPVRHKIQKDYENYQYSSYRIILSDAETELKRNEVINWFINKKEFIDYHRDDQVDPTTFNLLNIEDESPPIE
jgi:putative transposase